MDTTHLKRKGWSEEEIAHAQGIIARHLDNQTHEQFSLWAMVLVLAIGSAGIAVFLLPIILFTAPAVIVPMSLILGACMGFLLTHALCTLHVERKHHVAAAATLLGLSFAAVWLSVRLLEQRFVLFAATDALLICVPYTAGMLIPYITERRLHGSS